MKLLQILFAILMVFGLSLGQTITKIYDIQYTEDASGDSPLKGQTVTIEGIVSGESGAFGGSTYYVQDSIGAWSGIMVYDPNRNNAYGDSVRITASVSEYYGMTELGSVSEYVKLDSAKTVKPIDVTTGEIATDSVNAEAYEGVLVRVMNAAIVNPDLGNGEWSVDDGSGACRVDDAADYFFYPSNYDSVKWVTGLLNYSFNDTKIEPRLAMDVHQSGKYTRIQYFQQVRKSDLIKTPTNNDLDISYFYHDTVTIKGVVTMPTGLSYAGAGVKFIVSETDGGPWSGVQSYNPDSTLYPALFEGDIIEMTGYIDEYLSAPSHMTEFWITQPIDILDTGNDIPAPSYVHTGDLRLPVTAEQWGTVMVYVKDAKAVDLNPPGGFENFAVDDGTGSCLVDDDSDSLANYPDPPLGTKADSIRGWVYNHYGSYADSSTYKLEPLYVSDIVWGSGPPSVDNPSRDMAYPSSAQSVTVSADFSTNLTISEAALYYEVVTGGTSSGYTKVVMSNGTGGNTYAGTIPAQAAGSFVNYFFVGTDDAAQSTFLPPDTSKQQFCYPVKDGPLTISDVQYTPWPMGDSPFEGFNVELTGIVTTDTVANNYYKAYSIQDADGGPWNGIFLFGIGTELKRGDEVTVSGTITDYNPDYLFKWGNNTVMLVDQIQVNSSNNAYSASSLTTGELNGASKTAESYEGVLVEVSDLTLTAINPYDFTVNDNSGTCLVDGDFLTAADQNPNNKLYINQSDGYIVAFGDTVRPGETISFIKGIFTYSYGTYKISLRDGNDIGVTTGINKNFKPAPLSYQLKQNYPNPFNPETRIYFEIPKSQNVTIVVYNILGQRIKVLTKEVFAAGQHVINWDGRNQAGKLVPSGVYIYRIKAGNFIQARRMILLK